MGMGMGTQTAFVAIAGLSLLGLLLCIETSTEEEQCDSLTPIQRVANGELLAQDNKGCRRS